MKRLRSSLPYDAHPNPSQNASADEAITCSQEVERLFNKKFSFAKPNKGAVWALPETLFTSPVAKDWDPELNRFKTELNDLKSQLSDKDIKQWHQHTAFTHRSALVMPSLRNEYWVELCTQAWCKFYELVSSFDLIQPGMTDHGASINTVHLCEAPGAFVTSLNHFLKSHQRLKYVPLNWLATTLNPYYEGNSSDAMITDDRFVSQTQDNWFFGADDTGDLMNIDNLRSLQERISTTMATVHLVTADGSINCQNDPAEQELVVCQLHYCEVVTAISLLATGGSLVLKMFTMFEHQTACLVFLLNCTFQQVHVCKPATSKAGNSEVYVICLGFQGPQLVDRYLPKLLKAFGPSPPSSALLPISALPQSFLHQLRQCAALFKQYQMDTIRENLRLYPAMTGEQERHLQQVRERCRLVYVKRFAIRTINRNDKLCWQRRGCKRAVGANKKKLQGSFTERRQQESSHWMYRLSNDYQQESREAVINTQTLQNADKLQPCDLATWHITSGRQLSSINCSSFCDSDILDDWRIALSHSPEVVPYPGKDADVSCSQAVGDVIVAELASLKISRSGANPPEGLCLLTPADSGDNLLKLLKTSQRWSFLECLVPGHSSVNAGAGADEGSLTWQQPLDQSHLTNQAVIESCCQRLQRAKVLLIYADVTSVTSVSKTPGLDEIQSRLSFLVCVILAMHGLDVGGSLIVHLPTILTRFTTGLVYILYKTFQKVTFIVDAHPKHTSNLFILAGGFTAVHPKVTKHLWEVYTSVVNQPPGTDVLQFISHSQMCESDFTKTVKACNEALIHATVCTLVHNDRPRQQQTQPKMDVVIHEEPVEGVM